MGKTHEQMRSEVMRKIKFGQTLTIRGNEQESEPLKVRVLAFYPEFILCQGVGYNVCFRYHEFWTRLQSRQIKAVIPDMLKR